MQLFVLLMTLGSGTVYVLDYDLSYTDCQNRKLDWIQVETAGDGTLECSPQLED